MGLDQIPNAISDDPDTDSSEVLATTKALRSLKVSVNHSLVGMVAHFPTTTAPSGWLRANGASVSRTVYAALFNRIGTLFGSDSPSTFKLPDLRAEFIRGWDDGRGQDVGRALGSWAASQNLLHGHDVEIQPGGAHDHEMEFPRDLGQGHTDTERDAFLGDEIEEGTAVIKTSRSPDHTHGVTVATSGGNESRPRSIALLACIKY